MHNFMQMAIDAASESRDPSVQNGAVLVDPDGVLLGTGCNRFPDGVRDFRERWVRPEKYAWIEHAERNAIFDAARSGRIVPGSVLYCPWAACTDCARAIIQVGIAQLVRCELTESRWTGSIATADQMLLEAGVDIVTLPLSDFDIPDGLRLGQIV